jgi:ELWxxDGT repeat protein
MGSWLRPKVNFLSRKFIFEELEQRIVLDAAVQATTDDHQVQNDHLNAHAGASAHEGVTALPTAGAAPGDGGGAQGATGSSHGSDPLSTIFPNDISQVMITNVPSKIDSLAPDTTAHTAESGHDLKVSLISNTIAEAENLAAAVKDGVQAIAYDGQHDNLATLTEKLEALTESSGQKIGTLAILDHSSSGSAFIGSDKIDFCNLSDYSSQLATLSTVLSDNAQIQFFGCSVAQGEEGKALVDRIASITKADVFASVDPSGGTTGDWILEYASDSSIAQSALFAETGLQQVTSELSTAWQADIVKDINTWTLGSDAGNFVDVNGTLFFTCDDKVHGIELWKSDGTEQGTVMVKDIRAGTWASIPSDLTNVNGTLFFAAFDDGVHGRELWKSDGTEQGTVMVKDIYAGTEGSYPNKLTNVNGTLYFTASDGVHGYELWKSDGTAAGTVMVKDIYAGTEHSSPSSLTNVNGTLFFTCDDKVHGTELWKSDGTEQGTVMVKDIHAGTGYSLPSYLTNVNGTLFFTVNDEVHGTELWKSDGTAAGTVMVKDIYAGTGHSSPSYLANVNGALFFTANDGIHGTEIWKSDGTEQGTVMVKDISAGSSSPSNLTNVDATLFFTANDGSHGTELWKSDGTEAGTVMVKDIHAGAGYSSSSNLTNVNGTLFFANDDGAHGTELWKSDGTDAGTVMVKDIGTSSYGSRPSYLTSINGALFFTAYDESYGQELWKSDGTDAGTVMVKDICTQTLSSYPSNLTDVNGTLFFTANDKVHGAELWKSDGTAAGTVMVKDIWAGIWDSSPSNLTNVNGLLFFTASDGFHGRALWKSDGTDAGTVMVKAIYSWSNFTNVNGTLFFTVEDWSHGEELWKSDGTAAGTVMVKDIYPGTGHSNPSYLTNVNGTLFFTAEDGAHGNELWKSDGTEAGTVMVKDIWAGNGYSYPSNLTTINGTLFFTANDGIHGSELWTSDGTAAGTVMVKDIWAGNGYSYPSNLTNVNGTLFFAADDGFHGSELWKSDGTAAGTIMVRDIYAGTRGSELSYLTNVNGTLFFTARTGAQGIELWTSDGTAAGTAMVKDICAGTGYSNPSYLTNVNGTLFFTASDGIHGSELWTSDGTAAGTVMVKDISAGFSGSYPSYLANVNGTLFFTACDGHYGTELWKADLYTNASPVNQVPLSVLAGVQDTPFTFGAGARISVFDADAGSAAIQVNLTTDHGILSLATTSGLASVVGNGTNNVMLQGAQDAINTALNGLVFTPESGYLGQATITVSTNDLGATGSGGARTDLDTVTLRIRPESYYVPFIASGEVPSLVTYEGNKSPVFTLTAHDMDFPDLTNVNFVIAGHTIPGDTGDGALTDLAVAGGTLRPIGYVAHDGNGTYTQQFIFTHPDGPASVSVPYLFKSPVYNGTTIENSNTAAMPVGVSNLAPVFSGAIADQAVFEGKTATVDFTGLFTDVPSDTLTYAYRVDGRGWVDLGTNTSFDLTFSGGNTHVVFVRAMDGDGGIADSNMVVFTPRTIDQTVFEGQTATVDFTGLFTNVPSQTLTYAYQMDGGQWVSLGTNTSFHLTYGDDGVHSGVVAATDQNGTTRTENFTVTVNNLAPTFAGTIANQTVFDGQTVAVDFTNMFSDVPSDTMTYAYKVDSGNWVDLGTDTSFSTTVTGIGVHHAAVRATDDDGGIKYSNVFSLTACGLGQVVTEGETATINFTGLFASVQAQTLTYAYQVDGGQWVDLGTNTSFSLTYGDDGIHTGVVAAIDENGLTRSTEDFVITVNNKAPVFSGIIADQTVYEGRTVTFDFTGMFTDVPADTLTYAYKIGSDGEWVNLGTNTSFTLDCDQIGVKKAAVRATDDDGGVNYSNVFTITARNLDRTVAEGETATVDFTGFFTDVPSAAMTYAYQVDGGQWVSLGTNTSFGLTYGDNGIHTGVVAATDANGLTTTENFTITVKNQAPVFSGGIPNKTAFDGSAVTVDFTGMFTDVPADTVTYAYQIDGGAWVNLGTNTSFDVAVQELGAHRAAVRATDDDGGINYSNVFTITWPVLDQTIDEGQTAVVDFTGLFTDVSSGPLTYAYQVDGGAWVNLGTNTFFRLTYGDEGVHPGVVSATDEHGVTHTIDFTVTVNNLAPVFTGNLADRTVYEGETVIINFTGMFSDVPADTLTYSYKVDDGAWVNLGTNTSFCLTFGQSGVHRVNVSASDGDGGVAYSRTYSDTYTPIVMYPVFSLGTGEPHLKWERIPGESEKLQEIFSPSLDTFEPSGEQHVNIDTHRDFSLSTIQTGLTRPTEAGFTILVKSAGAFENASASSFGAGSAFGGNGSSGGLISGISSSPNAGIVTGGSGSGFHSDTYGSSANSSDVYGGSYGDSSNGFNGGGSSLVPGWSVGDWPNGSRNGPTISFAQDRTAQDGDSSDPYGKRAEADGDEGWPNSEKGVSTGDHFADAVKQAQKVSEDLSMFAVSGAFVMAAEVARRKVLADRKAAMAAEGLTPVDDKDNDPRTMTFTNADGTKTVEYTLNDAIGFGGWGCTESPLRSNYVATELITERTEHKVGDTIQYEFTTSEETNHYYMTYDFRNGFSPMTLKGSLENAASVDGNLAMLASNVPAIDPGGGQSDPTVEQAMTMVLDAVDKSEATTPDEAILAITKAKKDAKKLLDDEIKRISLQIRNEYRLADDAESRRLMQLEVGLELIDKTCSQALANELLRKCPRPDVDDFGACTSGRWSALYIIFSKQWDMLPSREDCDSKDPFWQGFWDAYDECMADRVVSPNPDDSADGQFVPVRFFVPFPKGVDPDSWLGRQFRNPYSYVPGPGGVIGAGEGIAAQAFLKALEKLGPTEANTALGLALRWLGSAYTEIAPGVFRSKDGLRLFRMNTNCLLGKHGGGPHVNFELFNEAGERLKNVHLLLKP